MTSKQINVAIAEACGWRKDYAKDLNAMHSALLTLTPTQQDAYAGFLGAITGGRSIDYGACRVEASTKILFAEAREQAQAFLRTLGKWTEYDSAPEPTLETCPACGKELEERSEPAQCAHQYVRVGVDEDGWVQRRCEKCGEFE